jgi:hypothetical protein
MIYAVRSVGTNTPHLVRSVLSTAHYSGIPQQTRLGRALHVSEPCVSMALGPTTL